MVYGLWGALLSLPVILLLERVSRGGEPGPFDVDMWGRATALSVVVPAAVHAVGGWVGSRRRGLLGGLSVMLSVASLPCLLVATVLLSPPDGTPVGGSPIKLMQLVVVGGPLSLLVGLPFAPFAWFPVRTLRWLFPESADPGVSEAM